MNLKTMSLGSTTSRPAGARRIASCAGLCTFVIAAAVLLPGGASKPGTSAARTQATAAVTFDAISAPTGVSDLPGGTAIPKFDYLVVRDDTGDSGDAADPGSGVNGATRPVALQGSCRPANDANYPDNCALPSFHSVRGGTAAVDQIVAQGTQADFPAGGPPNLERPPGKYVVSVTAPTQPIAATGTFAGGDLGFKIDGAHFNVGATPTTVTVKMDPTPLPLSTIRVQVFEDISGANGQFDVPAEDGLAGFVGHIHDVLGETTTDWYGNPLCTIYQKAAGNTSLDPFVGPYALDGNGDPIIAQIGGACVSGPDGIIEMGNLGRNRYSVQVTQPAGVAANYWHQTTTLEGGHDWDTWPQESATGFDQEVLVGKEPAAEVFFGFIHDQNQFTATAPETKGTLTGIVNGIRAYTPPAGGLVFGGEAGNTLDPPCKDCFIALGDLQNGDTTVYTGAVNPDGTFSIPNVTASDYEVTVWDRDQDFLVETNQATVRAGQTTDMGIVYLAHWFAIYHGSVFVDTNENGKRDPGEQGLANQAVQLLSRDNSLQDQGINTVTTDSNGDYLIREGYPLGQHVVMQVYNDLYKTTGVTYQTDNQPEETTVTGPGVDISVFGLVGLSSRVDWGVKPYAAGENGGIVSTVYYATTRNELDARFSAVEDYEAGISGLKVDLYAPVPDYQANPVQNQPDGWARNPDGSYQFGPLLNQYTTEQYHRPKNCTARGVDGIVLTAPFLPAPTAGGDCIEAFMMSNQVGTGPLDPASTNPGGQTLGTEVNGNYGFGDLCAPVGYDPAVNGPEIPNSPSTYDPTTATGCAGNADPISLPSGTDYLVKVEIPADPAHPTRPMFTPEREEDVNIATGNVFQPQAPPPACAGPLHTVDVGGPIDPQANPVDGYPAVTTPDGFTVSPSTPVTNPDFIDIGGSPYEGQPKPLCDVRLVTLQDRHSVSAGTFNLFTKVPVPGRYRLLVTDDLTLSADPQDVNYGEKLGIPHLPIGFYDWTGRVVYTAHTDTSGIADVILPSTDSYNCPLPAGPCPNVYRLVANDPGSPLNPNTDFQPGYRSIATNFQLWPNITLPADLAPWPISLFVEGPGQQTLHPAVCDLKDTIPQLFAVDKPYILQSARGTSNGDVTITGFHFGSSSGPSRSVTLDGVPMAIQSWTDHQIVARVTTASSAGSHQLVVTTAGGQTIDGLTFHIIGGSFSPRVLVVAPSSVITLPAGTTGTGIPSARFTVIQAALEEADTAATRAAGGALVVVYPGTPGQYDPLGTYYENLIIHSPVKLQGVGPGGVYPAGTPLLPGEAQGVPGSIIDGSGFTTLPTYPIPTGAPVPELDPDLNYAMGWRELLFNLDATGGGYIPNLEEPSEGAVISVFARQQANGRFRPTYKASIDGFTIQGGDPLGTPGNLNDNGGGPVPNPVGDPPPTAAAITQGGGIFVNGSAHYLRITNNVLRQNGGAYGGAIRLGTPNGPDAGEGPNTNHNDNIAILNNRIVNNGGSNLAGGVAIFDDSDNYELAYNDVCGNFSAEYGGGISHFGRSDNGSIHDNKIYFNGSYDEGGGVMIAGELPANPAELSLGSGPVSIYNNLIQNNIANDDGGGLRFLQAGNFPIDVSNNVIANNVSTHEGGGVAFDDATNVRFVNNTVTQNITTATAATSNGQPAPAGISDTGNSIQLQATLAASHAKYSDPSMFNNIFWHNYAGTYDYISGTIAGVGQLGDPGGLNEWDMGTADGVGPLHPHTSLIEDTTRGGGNLFGYVDDGTNALGGPDPGFLSPYTTQFTALPWRGDPHFVGIITIAIGVNGLLAGNYHLPTPVFASSLNLASARSGVTVRLADIGRASFVFPKPVFKVVAPKKDIDGQQRYTGGAGPTKHVYPGADRP